jgi:flavin-dependent thymidylate synthase
MNIFDKIKELFRKDKKFDKEVKLIKDDYGELSINLLSFSDASYMSSYAAKMCVGQEVEKDYDKRLNHVSRVVNRGHESTIAHSNIIMLIFFDTKLSVKFAEISKALKFTEYATSEQDNGTIALLIGGSIRAYKYFFREAKDLNNIFCVAIKNTLYQSTEYVFFEDFIKDGIMFEDEFKYYPLANTSINEESAIDEDGKEYTEQVCDAVLKEQNILEGKVCDINYADDVFKILDLVERYGFTLRDVLKVTICIVTFHDISRIISQQLTRHHAGISQESQRYVDYSKAQFIDPTKFNEEKYSDTEKAYHIKIRENDYYVSSKFLGETLLLIYQQLIEQDMFKQDARGYLPENVGTKLVMTFTFADLLHFIKERKADAAQPEAQFIAEDMIEGLYKYEPTTYLFNSIGLNQLIDLAETPVYKAKTKKDLIALDESIDEVISEEEEVQ